MSKPEECRTRVASLRPLALVRVEGLGLGILWALHDDGTAVVGLACRELCHWDVVKTEDVKPSKGMVTPKLAAIRRRIKWVLSRNGVRT